MNISIPDEITNIMEVVKSAGFEIYIIGGFVRDMIIGVPSKDVDLFTNATGDEILSLFPNGKIIGKRERQEKILTVIVNDIEISSYRSNGDRTEVGSDIFTHLSTCDTTMNAIAMDINGNIIDPYYGRSHINDNLIHSVGDPTDRIQEDKLRAFRAIRFSLRFGFDIDKNLSDVICKTDISDLPVERIREEILKIIIYPNGLKTLQDSGLLTKIIPEFGCNIDLNGGHHHNETVDAHMHNTQNIACSLTDNPILIFAISLHDIGKGYSYQIKTDGGGISFHQHEKSGAIIIHDVMTRLKFSSADIKYTETIIAEHMVEYDDKMSDGAFIRRFSNLENDGVTVEDYMIMRYCDYQGNTKNPRVKFGDYLNTGGIHVRYYDLKFSGVPFGVKDLTISGHDIMAMGFSAGPVIGNILDDVFTQVVNGNIENVHHVLILYVKAKYYV